MLKKTIALTLALSVLLACLAADPAALASEYYSARTPLSGSSSAKINNVALAVEAINGTRVPTGRSFSFNETVGRRSESRGYMKAPNGRGAIVTGGGVAQAAATLYLTLLKVRSDIVIDPVKTYGSRFTDNYVSDTDYAVVTDYNADIDFSFTNYGEVLVIDMWYNSDYVYCSVTVGDDVFGPVQSENTDNAKSADPSAWGSWSDWVVSTLEPQPEGDSDGGPERELLGSVCLNTGGDYDVVYNVSLAADSITDTTLNRGDVFSFNDIVGPRTQAYGYRRALNGRGAKVYGGGVAQVASVIWLAIKDIRDVSIVEKSTYGSRYNQTYVDSSADAILTDYSAGRDFSFRYNGFGSMTIYTYVQDGWLYCDIYEDNGASAWSLDNVG